VNKKYRKKKKKKRCIDIRSDLGSGSAALSLLHSAEELSSAAAVTSHCEAADLHWEGRFPHSLRGHLDQDLAGARTFYAISLLFCARLRVCLLHLGEQAADVLPMESTSSLGRMARDGRWVLGGSTRMCEFMG
jgi:hypothetical protein